MQHGSRSAAACPGGLQVRGDLFGMLQVALKDLEASLKQTLKLGIACRGYKSVFERAIHRLVVSDLVIGIGPVESRAAQLCQFGGLFIGLLQEAAACVIVL